MSLPVILRPLANADVQQIHAELEVQATGDGVSFIPLQNEPSLWVNSDGYCWFLHSVA